MRDDFMAFREQLLCSAVILEPKWLNTKFVLGPKPYQTCKQHRREPIGPHSEWRKRIYIAQVPLDNALVLGNLCEYRHK